MSKPNDTDRNQTENIRLAEMRRCPHKNTTELELEGFHQWESAPEDVETRKAYIEYVDHLTNEWQDQVRLRSRIHQREAGPPACESEKRITNSPRTDEAIATRLQDMEAYPRVVRIKERWINRQPLSDEDVAYLQTNVFWRRVNLPQSKLPPGTAQEYSAKYRLEGRRCGAKLMGRSWNKRVEMLAARQKLRAMSAKQMERINQIAERPTTIGTTHPKVYRYQKRCNYIRNRQPYDGKPITA